MLGEAITWSGFLAQLDCLITECDGALGIDSHKAKLVGLLNRLDAVDQQAEFLQYIHFDESGYTKNLVRQFGNECNVIIMCWAPTQSSAFHSHEGSKCFVKVLAGQLTEQQVHCNNDKLEFGGVGKQTSKTLHLNDVSYIDDSLGAHKVSNESSSEPAITLHIYLPPYTKCKVFDTSLVDGNWYQSRNNSSRTIDVTFKSTFGSTSK